MNLESMGWSPYEQEMFEPYAKEGFAAGRVVLEHKHLYRVYTEIGEVLAEIAGKMRYAAEGRADYPAVGDWVVLRIRDGEQRATIHAILPRRSKFSRKVAGSVTEEQIVATNVDTVFLVTALNRDFNVRRVERYLTLAWESGANPVIVLSKADLCEDAVEKAASVESIAFGVPVFVTSSVKDLGIDQLKPYLAEGRTVALLGSSGAGKSTLINRLYGSEIQATGEIREGDDRGKHTTTHRELIVLPTGGILIDTPGMRELQLWDAEEGLSNSFQDIEELAQQCFFRDCQHNYEPDCAVRLAMETGNLEPNRYRNYLKLQKELAYLARKEQKHLQLQEKQKWKQISKSMKKRKNRP